MPNILLFCCTIMAIAFVYHIFFFLDNNKLSLVEIIKYSILLHDYNLRYNLLIFLLFPSYESITQKEMSSFSFNYNTSNSLLFPSVVVDNITIYLLSDESKQFLLTKIVILLQILIKYITILTFFLYLRSSIILQHIENN